MIAERTIQALKERPEPLITSEFLQSLKVQKEGLCINKKAAKPARVVESTARKWPWKGPKEGVFTQYFVEKGHFRNGRIRVLF